MIFLGRTSRQRNARLLKQYKGVKGPIDCLQFDDLITAQHTKCKPITCTLVVGEGSRIIVDYCVAQIPAFGHLAKISRKKYGHCADHSRRERGRLFKRLNGTLPQNVVFRSDEHKHYPVVINRYFPSAKHLTHKGSKATVNGQGELKKLGRDPLFSIKHTLGMCRDKMSRLTRRSWNLSKKIERLDDHMAIYVEAHNRKIWIKLQKQLVEKSAAL